MSLYFSRLIGYENNNAKFKQKIKHNYYDKINGQITYNNNNNNNNNNNILYLKRVYSISFH